MNLRQAMVELTVPAVLVTVAQVRGSTPREAGTHMLVDRGGSRGTIGGGQLEHRAIGHARDMLACAEGARLTWSGRLSLGAAFGQCCGGDTVLLYERLTDGPGPWSALIDSAPSTVWVAVTSEHHPAVRALVSADDRRGDLPAGELGAWVEATARRLAADASAASQVIAAPEQLGGSLFFFDLVRPPDFNIVLFGAGHVGRAIVDVLRVVPCSVTWIDDRPELLPVERTGNVWPRYSRAPDLEAADLPPGSLCLVMTYSHAMDRKICAALLARDDLPYIGLIGSRTKRASFEKHWRRHGMDEARMARLVCPIGIDSLRGKEPGVIAVAVAAQLLQVQQALSGARVQGHGR